MSDKPTRRPGAGALGVLVIATAFIAGPTPGDVGGCGNDLSGDTVPGDQPESEYDFFDQSLCAHMCLRLRTLGVLCEALSNPPANCQNDGVPAYVQCVRGGVPGSGTSGISSSIFQGAAYCPHSCANYQGVYTGATAMDIEACGRIIDGYSENQITTVIVSPPGPCVGVCTTP